MTEPNSYYLIRYTDGSYNYGEGFDVTKSEATIYSTLEEAQEQSEGLCGVECIEEVCGGVKMTYYPLDKVTRIEIIDQDGRSYVNWDDNNKVELSFQDDERTLKVFISRVNPDEREPHSLITKTLKNHYDELNEIADNVGAV